MSFSPPVFNTPICFHFPMMADSVGYRGSELTPTLIQDAMSDRFENSRVLQKGSDGKCYHVIGRGYAWSLEWSVGWGFDDAAVVSALIHTTHSPTVYTVNYSNVLGVSLHAAARRSNTKLAPVGQWTMFDMVSLALPTATLSLRDREDLRLGNLAYLLGVDTHPGVNLFEQIAKACLNPPM